MIHECIKCKEDFLTEADPFIVFPKPSGSELQCLRCYQQREAKLVEALKTADNIPMSFDEYRDATDRKETSKSNTKWHTFERILYDTIKLGWHEARKVLKELEIEL